jgi:hypothetical protein
MCLEWQGYIHKFKQNKQLKASQTKQLTNHGANLIQNITRVHHILTSILTPYHEATTLQIVIRPDLRTSTAIIYS